MIFLEDLTKFSSQIKSVKKIQAELDLQNSLDAVQSIFGQIDSNFYELAIRKFDDWLSLTTESQISTYIKNLETTVLLKGDENLQKFFAFVTDICVNHALDSL